jgi:hypothetical protein
VWLTLEVTQLRYRLSPSSVLVEIVAAVLEVNRHTVRRNLTRLFQAGLVDAREWKTDVGGETRNAGYLWQVKLDPNSPVQPRLQADEFQHPWRDLGADINAGLTAYSQRQQSKSPQANKVDITSVLAWALPLGIKPLPFSTVTVADSPVEPQPSLAAMFDLPYLASHNRASVVDCAARAIAYHLGDQHSLTFYRRLLWRFAQLSDRGMNWFQPRYDQVLRAGTDVREGFARRGGAVLISRLKGWAIWDELEHLPLQHIVRCRYEI